MDRWPHRGRDDVRGPRFRRTPSLLEIRHVPSGQTWTERLDRTRAVIGREDRADVVLRDTSVSPLHAELVRGPGGQWLVHDLGSPKGTLVHGHRYESRLLMAGDELSVGTYRLRLRSGDSSADLAAIEPPSPCMEDTVQIESIPPPPIVPRVDGPGATGPEGSPPLTAPSGGVSALHLSMVMALSRELMQADAPGARHRLLCEFLTGHGACGDSATVVRLSGPRTARAIAGPLRREGPNLPLYLSSWLTTRVWETRQPACHVTPSVFNRDAATQPCPHLSGTVAGGWGQVRAPLCTGCSGGKVANSGRGPQPTHVKIVCPLHLEEDFLDALCVELIPERWSPDWCTLVALVAEAYQQANLVWEMRSQIEQASAVEHELEMARQIQQSLLPQNLDGMVDTLDMVVGFEPCHWVGGDYADAMLLPDGRVLLAVGDVCGKGMQAALVASSLHTYVRASVDLGLPLPNLVTRINRYLCRHLPDHVFVTLICVAVDVTTGDLEVVAAGHPSALIADSCGRVWSLDVGHNVGLGLMETEIVSGHHQLAPDQVILLYTDGLTEAINEQREPLGTERLAQMLSSMVSVHGAWRIDSMKEALLSGLRGYRGSLLTNDDTTFLLARWREELVLSSRSGRAPSRRPPRQ